METLPAAVIGRLEELGIGPSDIRLAASADLDMRGESCVHWILATDKQLLSIPEIPTGDEVIIALDLIETARVCCVVGSGYLQVKVSGVPVDAARFTNVCRHRFERFTAQFDNLRKKHPVDGSVLNEPHPLLCPTCGLPRQSEHAACPRCLKQGTVLSRLSRLMTPYLNWIIALLFSAVFSVVLSLVPPQLTRILVDDVLTSRSHVDWLIWVVLALVGAALAKAQFDMVVGTLSTSVGTLITYDLRKQMFTKLQELSVDYYDKNPVGTLMTRFSKDSEVLHGFVSQVGQGLLVNFLLICGIGIMLFSINARLAVYVMIPIPFVIFGTLFFWRRIYPLYYRMWDSQAKMSSFLNSVLSGIRLVKAFAQEGKESERFAAHSVYLRDANRGVNLSIAAFNPMMTFLFSLGGLIIWYAGGKEVLAGYGLTLGQLMAFLGYIGMFYTPLSNMAIMSSWFSDFTTAANRIFELLDTEPLLREPENPVVPGKVSGRIELERVTFGYDPYFPVLKDISISIAPGELIGIVGRSGSGKSTLVNLICRFYDPQKGTVRIDGTDARQLSSANLRRNIGLVLQEPFLFRGAIADNIAYGKSDASYREIIAAARAANAHEFIMRMPAGYDFRLGERGAGLSGGEKQRIGIARALLCDLPVLILDEATSSVDTETEKKIQEALAVLCKGRTTIAIAHRLSTLRGADRIYVMDDGRIIEQGNHEELMASDGTYAKLVRMQTLLSSIET